MTDDKSAAPAVTMTDERAEQLYRILARVEPVGIPDWMCEMYGLKDDGSIAESGLTDEGRAHARQLEQTIVRKLNGARRSGAAAGDIGGLVAALGLVGPVRAAMRAAAQTFAAALNDGDSDDAGIDAGASLDGQRGVLPDGTRVTRYTLGEDPYVLIRVQPVAGGPVGLVTVVCGGGVQPGDDGIVSPIELVESALDAVRRGGITVDSDVESEIARVQGMSEADIAGLFGLDLADIAQDGASPEGPAADSSGPSTEWPSTAPVPDRLPGGEPFGDPGQTSVPADEPRHDGGASEAPTPDGGSAASDGSSGNSSSDAGGGAD